MNIVFVLTLVGGIAASISADTPKIRGIAAIGSSLLCQIVHAHELGDSGHREYFNCDLIAQEGIISYGLNIDLPEDVVSKHEQALNRGEWYVNITGATIDEKNIEGYGTIRTGITLNTDSTITTVAPEDGRLALLSAQGIRRELDSPANRQLQTDGKHTVLVLRVSVSDSSPTFSSSQLADDFFGNSFSVVTQYSGCSFGAVQFMSYDLSNPVIDVQIQGSAASFSSSTLWPLAMAAGASLKGIGYLTNLAQHVAIVMPPGLSDSSGYYASGSVGGWWSMYNDKWGGFPNFGVHELGHNLGMGHAGVGNDPYNDMSDIMGYGDTQQFGISKCFNGYHYWYLNWFASRSISVDPYAHSVLTLAAFAHYDRTSESQYVVIKVDTYYIIYNRATGINSGVDDVPDKVTVAQSQPSVFSLRVAALDNNSGAFQVANYGGGSQPLIIKVCSIVTGGALDYAVVSIEVGVSDCTPTVGSGGGGTIAFSQTTTVPSSSPVASPTPPPPTPAPVTPPPTVKPTKAPVASPTPAPVAPTPKPIRPTSQPVAPPTVAPVPATSRPTLRNRRRRTVAPAMRSVVAPTRAPR